MGIKEEWIVRIQYDKRGRCKLGVTILDSSSEPGVTVQNANSEPGIDLGPSQSPVRGQQQQQQGVSLLSQGISSVGE